MRLSIVLAFLSLICLFGVPVSPVLANDDVMASKINLAGRQRMLTQRIAKAACYISLFSNVDKHLEMLERSSKEFDNNLISLRHGNPGLQFPAEKDPAVLMGFNRVEETWKYLKFASNLLLETPDYPGADVDLIAEFNMPALTQSHAIVQLLENQMSGGNDITGLIPAINVAGRLRMLSQKSAKEFCLVSYGKNVRKHQLDLKKSIEEFDQTISDLKNGNENRNILPVPTREILDVLLNIESHWLRARDVMINAADKQNSRSADFKVISFTNEVLLQQSNRMVRKLVAENKFMSQ